MNRITWVIAALVLMMASGEARAKYPPMVEVPLSFFDQQLSAGNVKSVDVEHDRLTGEFIAPPTWNGQSIEVFRTVLPEGATSQWTFTEWLLANRRDAIVTVQSPSLMLNILVPLIPWLLIFGFIWFFVFRQLRGAQRGAYTGDALRVHVVHPPGPISPSPLPPPPLS
jgi:ATP-dependent Zn protease